MEKNWGDTPSATLKYLGILLYIFNILHDMQNIHVFIKILSDFVTCNKHTYICTCLSLCLIYIICIINKTIHVSCWEH